MASYESPAKKITRSEIGKLQPIDSITIRPSEYYAKCYSQAEIREENQSAKSSAIKPPEDLE